MAKRTGAQPGQIGKIRYKEISTKGVAAGRVLGADGSGGCIPLVPGGGANFNDLLDVDPTAQPLSSRVIVGNGTKWQSKTPDLAGLVDKTSAQSISGIKSFTSGLNAAGIAPTAGSVLPIAGRVQASEAIADNELPTWNQVKIHDKIVTVGPPSMNPDCYTLIDAINLISITDGKGGIIKILDNGDYSADGINRSNRSLRNVVIVGNPGAASPAEMPFVSLAVDPDVPPLGSSSSGPAETADFGAWHIVGCRLGAYSILAAFAFPEAAVTVGVVIEDCVLTSDDPFGKDLGPTSVGAILYLDSCSAEIVVKNTRIDWQALMTNPESVISNGTAYKYILRSAGDASLVARLTIQNLRPMSAALAVPAPVNVVRSIAADVIVVEHDLSVVPYFSSTSTIIPTQTDQPAVKDLGSLEPFNLRINYAVSAATCVIKAGLRAMVVDRHNLLDPSIVGGYELRHKMVQVAGDITIDITASGENGLDTGSEAEDRWYYVYLIYNPLTKAVSGLFSASTSDPVLPTDFTLARRIGAVFNNCSYDFEPARQDGHQVFFENMDIASAEKTVETGDPSTSFTTVGTSKRCPPTGSRVTIVADIALATGTADIVKLFAAHGDKTGSAGGVLVAKLQGSATDKTGAASGRAEVDLNASNQFALRRESASEVLSTCDVYVVGYYDRF